MAIPTTTPQFNTDKVSDVLVFTHAKHRKKMADNVFKGNPFQAHMLMAGRVNQDGGASLVYEVEVVDDAAGAATISTTTDATISPTWKQIAMAARYDYKQLTGSIVIRDYEKALNMGDSQVLSLVEKRFRNAEKEMAQKLESMLIKAGSAASTDDFHGLGAIVASGALGGITGGSNAATQVATWQSPTIADRVVATTGSNADSDPTLAVSNAGKEWLSKLVRKVTRGSTETPDALLTNSDTFSRIETIAWDKARYTGGQVNRNDEMWQLKFDNFLFDHALCMWTDNASLVDGAPQSGGNDKVNPIYVLNTEYLELVCHSDMWMDLKGPIRDREYLSDAFQFQSLGNLCCDYRAGQIVSWQVGS